MKKLFAFVLSLAVFISPAYAFAQAEQATSDVDLNSGFLINPSFQVGNIVAAEDPASGALTGTVDVINDNDAAFGGIHVQALFMDPAPVMTESNTLVPDNGRVFDRFIMNETYQFAPHEQKTIPFIYNPPKVPTGQYRLRLQVITENGNQYGWDDHALTYGKEGAQFVFLADGPLLVDKKPYYPLEGVNVAPGTELTATLFTQSTSTKAITATPILTTYAFDIMGPVISTKKGDSVTISPKKDSQQQVVIKAPDAPGAYQATLVYQDENGKNISSLGQYRWVVTGVTARVVSGRVTSLDAKQAKVQFEVAGPADRVTFVNVAAHIEMLDGANTVGAGDLTITDLGKSGMVSAASTVDLASPLTDPGLRITLTDTSNNKQLDVYEIHVPPAVQGSPSAAVPAADKSSATPNIYIGLGIVAVLIVLFAWLLIRMRNVGKPNIPISLLLVAGTVSIGLSLFASYASGVVIDISPMQPYVVSQGGYFAATINNPTHNSTYPKTSVPVSVALVYSSCGNIITSPIIAIYNYLPGGKPSITGQINGQGTYPSNYTEKLKITSPSGSWNENQSLSTSTNGSFDNLVFAQPGGAQCTTAQKATLTRSYRGNLSINTSAAATTLMFVFRVQGVSTSENVHAQLMQANYAWINFPVTTTPTPPPPTNHAPVAVARISKDAGAFSTGVTVTQGVPATLQLSGSLSSDSDGWTNSTLGVSNGGKCEWNYDLNTGTPVYEVNYTNLNPPTPSGCYVYLGSRTFNNAPGTYTYQVLRVTDKPGLQSNNASVTITVVAPTTPTPPPPTNHAPVAVAKISKDGITYGSSITVTRGVPYPISLGGDASSDSDGWTNSTLGVSNGGKCEWNADLNPGTPTFEINYTNPNPPTPSACQAHIGTKTFNDAPGPYTYGVLQITDKPQAKSNIGYVTVNVVAPAVPAVDLKANNSDDPITIPSGTSANLSWTTTNAQSCYATNSWSGWKSVPTGSEQTANLVSSQTYVLTCYSTTGASASDVVTVNVVASPVSVDLKINGVDNPAPVQVNTTIYLFWQASNNADTCTASNDWSGPKSTSGNGSTTPTQVRTYTYTITCEDTASGNTGTDTVSIEENAEGGQPDFNTGNFQETR